jgi:hypothetical protein
MESLLKLRRFLEERPPKKESCELCGAALAATHGHVVDLERRRLMCTCRPCYLLFTHRGAGAGKFRSVPDRYRQVPELAVDPGRQMPVGMVFYVRNSETGRVAAFYPSPAGATESGLAAEMWEEMVQAHPVLGTLEADVEALLISRGRDGATQSWMVPVDACYELVGRIRRNWKGFDGGEDARREIDGFFAELSEREAGSAA